MRAEVQRAEQCDGVPHAGRAVLQRTAVQGRAHAVRAGGWGYAVHAVRCANGHFVHTASCGVWLGFAAEGAGHFEARCAS